MKSELLTIQTFSVLLENTMREKNLSHIDAIIEICRVRELDVESIPELLTPKIKRRIQDEAASLSMLRKKASIKVV